MLRRKLLPIIALGVIALSRITPNAVHAVQRIPPAPAPVAQDDPMPEMRGSAIVNYVLGVDPYVAWDTWPTDAKNPANYSGYLPANDPHGNAVRVFVNPIALDAINAPDFDGELPPGSMIVMENYDVTPQSPAALVALTVRVKYPDFQTNDSDWFWVKAAPDGSTINAEGAVRSCVSCHEQSASDFVMSYTFANAAAPGSAGAAGPDLVAQTCTTCHTSAVVDGKSWNRDQWRAFLAGHFVPLDATALNALLAYLTTLPENGTASSPEVGVVGSSTGGIVAPHSTEGMTSCSTCHADPRANTSSSGGSVSTSAPSTASGIVAPHSTEGMTSCSTCHADPRANTSSNVSSSSVGSSGGTVIQTCTTCHTPHQSSSTTCTSCHTPHPPGGPDDHDDDHDDDHENDDHDDDHDDHEDDHDDDD